MTPPAVMPGRPLALAVLGLVAGFASGFLGIGGGAVIVPALVLIFDHPIKRAVGTSLATLVPVSLVGVVAELVVKGSNIHWAVGLVLTGGCLLGSWAGGWVMPRLPETPLRVAFGALLLFAAYRMFSASAAGDGMGDLSLGENPVAGQVVALAVGAVAGLASVLFGIGGGIVMVPALSLVFRDLPFHVVRATSLLTVLPTSSVGACQHRARGTVDVAVALCLVPAGLAGAILGVVSVNRLPAAPCRVAFAAFLLLAGTRLLLSTLGTAWRPRAISLSPIGGAGQGERA